MAAKAFAWSYSALTGFETCPFQHQQVKVLKVVSEKPSAEAMDGTRQHKALEDRVASGKPLPKDMRRWDPLMTLIDGVKETADSVTTEQKVCLNADLEPTGYFAKDAWVRGVIDLMVVKGAAARQIDYKTGKRKLDSLQLRLSAAIAFALYPRLQKISTSFWWLKSKEVDNELIYRAQVPEIWAEFEPRVIAMEEAVKTGYFPKNPSGLCHGWCPVQSCEHWRPKK